MIIEPRIRGFMCTTAHPAGCAAHVQQQIDYVTQQPWRGPKRVLVIGASTGYGLATRIATAFGAGAQTLGVFFERPAKGKRTASAGWYNTVAFEKAAAQKELYAASINGDAFSQAIKDQTIAKIKKDWGGQVDCVIYSVASPRRTDPKTGETYHSVLKPIGQSYSNKTVDVMTGQVSEVSLEPATEDEIASTIKVMGGADWQLWMDALAQAELLAPDVTTVAYSYIGPELTYPVYRDGTIGRAKADLEKTAHHLNEQLKATGGCAVLSVNKALVTQSSAAIPVVPLYISLLYDVMKAQGSHEGCIEQCMRLMTQRLYGKNDSPVARDEKDRVRLDDWELSDQVQLQVAHRWDKVSTGTLAELSDIDGYREAFHALFGFGLPGVDYSQEVDADCMIPSLAILNGQ